MARKTHPTDNDNDTGGDEAGGASAFAGTVRDSASQIWLAGLGAFAKAQQEGGKVFEALVKEGLSLQRKTQSAAEDRFSEATTRMASMASDISSRASGHWGKLESIFEERVARALKELDVPSAKDVQALAARIDDLERRVARLGAAQGKPARTAAAGQAAKPTPAGTGARRTGARTRAAHKRAE